VLHNGTKYRCKQTCTGVTPPNPTYWRNLDSVVPLGAMIQFGNVIAIDADGHPKFAGQTEFDLTWALCDGRNGTPNYVGRFARGGNSASVTARGADSFTLGVANLPAHSHGASVSTNGNHTHTRGSMNIQGTVSFDGAAIDNATGAFSIGGNRTGRGMGDTPYTDDFSFNAASNWTGETSQNGSHSHTVTIGNAGSGSAVSITNPFFKMAFFIKLPD
jgi:microcystin-dependent protein